jgi:hypothetical protein
MACKYERSLYTFPTNSSDAIAKALTLNTVKSFKKKSYKGG